MALHYTGEALFHFSRLCYFADKNDISMHGYSAWGVVFPTVRFLTLGMSILVFWFGLASEKAQQGVDFATGCYNNMFLRIVAISSVSILQIWLMWPYIQLQIRYRNEEREAKQKVAAIKQKQLNKKAGKKSASNGDVSKNKQKTH
jgi:translocating chain-associated membrane protein 1